MSSADPAAATSWRIVQRPRPAGALAFLACDASSAVLGTFIALLAAAFLIVPVIVAAVLSFDARSFLGPWPPHDLSLRWYRALLADPVYADGLVNSIEVACVATALSSVFGTMAALAIAEGKFRGRTAIETALLSPKFIPTVVIGFALLGLAARVRLDDAYLRLVLGHLVITLPFVVRAVLASLVGVRRNLTEAAMLLGASRARAWLDVLLPLARTGIVAGALMAFAISFDEVAVSLFLCDPFTQTLPIALVAQMKSNLNLTIAAVSTLYVGLVVAALLLLDRVIGIDRVVGRGLYG